MNADFLRDLFSEHQKQAACCPPPRLVVRFFDRLLGLLFPEYSDQEFAHFTSFSHHAHAIENTFLQLLERGHTPQNTDHQTLCRYFFDQLPHIRAQLHQDIAAMYAGDPAARSLTEVIRTYPGFYAIVAHRIAHLILNMEVELIPRIISEHAHSKTGIDIHPGAQIGNHFCIDHGTGVVIGETTQIGDYVKIYQGVTLGALSVRKSDAKKKRHPTIQDRVVIYAGATILGGKTVVGEGSTIGGNVWLTESVPPHSRIYYQAEVVRRKRP